jgi:hypothetical protein
MDETGSHHIKQNKADQERQIGLKNNLKNNDASVKWDSLGVGASKRGED